MNNDQVMGWAILAASLLGVVVYFWLTFMSPWVLLTIQVSAFLAVAAVLAIVAWIGYTLATTPPPVPLEDMDLDDFDLDDLDDDSLEDEPEEPEESEE